MVPLPTVRTCRQTVTPPIRYPVTYPHKLVDTCPSVFFSFPTAHTGWLFAFEPELVHMHAHCRSAANTFYLAVGGLVRTFERVFVHGAIIRHVDFPSPKHVDLANSFKGRGNCLK